MLEQLQTINSKYEKVIEACADMATLKQIRVAVLGKKGELTLLLRGFKDLTPEERIAAGKLGNQVKNNLEELLKNKTLALADAELMAKLDNERIDVTLPGYNLCSGALHPLTQITNEIVSIFAGLGFTVAEGPEIEQDYYNFEALNLPADHPARDMQDSFYINNELLLRTHTSPVQVRVMEKTAPRLPVKIVVPGRVFRRDDDATHSPMFHQVEGLMLGENVSLANLKGVLMLFAQSIFGEEVSVRYRPSYFPFTEPSAEMDVSCVKCKGHGCRVCSYTGWLEILGSGMVNPKVLRYGGYDPEQVTGFAFGMGIERIAMLKYGIDDLRLFYENDQRFLKQF